MALCACGDPSCDFEVTSRSRREGPRVWCETCGEYHYGVDAEECESPYCENCGDYPSDCECGDVSSYYNDGPNPVKVPSSNVWENVLVTRDNPHRGNLTQYVADFYLLECLANIDGFAPAKAAFRAFTEKVAREFAQYLDEIIGGELRHTARICRSASGIPADLFPYLRACGHNFERSSAWKVWRTMRKTEGIRALEMAETAFRDGKWGDGAYGGSSWATIAKVLISYYKSKLPASLFVDRCFSLEHNGGCVFDKQYKVKGSLRKCLDAHGNDDYRTLLAHASASVKALWNSKRHSWHSEEWLGAERAKPIAQCAVSANCVSPDWHHGACITEDHISEMVDRQKKWFEARRVENDKKLLVNFEAIMIGRMEAKHGKEWLRVLWNQGALNCSCKRHVNIALFDTWKNGEVASTEESDDDNFYGSPAWGRIDRLSTSIYNTYVNGTAPHTATLPDFVLELQAAKVAALEAWLKTKKISFAAIRRYVLEKNYYDGLELSMGTFVYHLRDMLQEKFGSDAFYEGGLKSELKALITGISVFPPKWAKTHFKTTLTEKEMLTYNTSWVIGQKMTNQAKKWAKVTKALDMELAW